MKQVLTLAAGVGLGIVLGEFLKGAVATLMLLGAIYL